MKNLLSKSAIYLSLVVPCLGGSLAVTPVGGDKGFDPNPYMIGWQFRVNSPVTVTALAFLDSTGAGLLDSHKVAIFDGSGIPLVSATVAAGAATPSQEGFRLSTVNYSLQPGTYTIGAQRLTNTDGAVVRAVSVKNIPQITYLGERELSTTDFTMPNKTLSLNEAGSFGPSFTISDTVAPVKTISNIVNSGSYKSTFTAGMYVTIFGTNLSPVTRAWNQSDFKGSSLPTSLDGVSVLVNDQPVYVEYISSGQVNIILPDSLPANDRVSVTVKYAGQPDVTGWIQLDPAAPAFFTWLTDTPDSGKYVVATHADGSRVGKLGLYIALPPGFTTPAKPGETIVLYGTAFGRTNPAAPEGALADKAYPVATMPTATVAGKPAVVAYAGVVSSLAKVYQVNLTLPADLADGDWPIVVTAGVQSSSILVTVAR